MPLVKQFKGVAKNTEFEISWEYISTPTIEVGARLFSVPPNLVTAEWVLCWDYNADVPIYLDIENPVPVDCIVLAWYTDTYFLEYYFIDSASVWGDYSQYNLVIPKAYNNVTRLPIKPDVNFRSFGKNYPGQSSLLNKVSTDIYPGLISGSVGSEPSLSVTPSFAHSLTSFFKDEIVRLDGLARATWETTFGPNSNTEYSQNLFGLARSDYNFVKTVPAVLKDAVVATLPTQETASNYIYLADLNGLLIHSLDDTTSFKYGVAYSPADVKLSAITLELGSRPIEIYAGDGKEGDSFFYATKQIVLTEERYEPTIQLIEPILAADFVRGYKYAYPSTQVNFPPGYIVINSTSGRFPATTGIRPWNIKPSDWKGIFNSKNTISSIEFLFKLYKLRAGAAYINDTITSGPEDFQPLTVWGLPTLIADFLADDILGTTDNSVAIRLPFSYKRGGLEWQLAHDICQAFLQNYTIGYHEFTADFSAADEPVFRIQEDDPILTLYFTT